MEHCCEETKTLLFKCPMEYVGHMGDLYVYLLGYCPSDQRDELMWSSTEENYGCNGNNCNCTFPCGRHGPVMVQEDSVFESADDDRFEVYMHNEIAYYEDFLENKKYFRVFIVTDNKGTADTSDDKRHYLGHLLSSPPEEYPIKAFGRLVPIEWEHSSGYSAAFEFDFGSGNRTVKVGF